MKHQARILFFIDGVSPSKEDLIQSRALDAQICFRNARMVPTDGALETCDGVAGAVPARYKKQYPPAELAIEMKAAAYEKSLESLGDTPAPVVASAPAAVNAPSVVTSPASAPASAPESTSATSAPGDAAARPVWGAAPAAAPVAAPVAPAFPVVPEGADATPPTATVRKR
jgi:hypothetical protein